MYFIPLLNIFEWLSIRGKIREQNSIEGTTCNDCLTILFCPLCALTQEAMEVQNIPGLMGMARE